MTPIRILVVDDHPIVRDGLRGHLASQPDLEVVGEAASAEEALAVLARTPVDVLVTDLRMPGRGGLDLIGAARAQRPGIAVLVLTTFDTDEEISAALEAGARGYLLKDAARETIHAAVRDGVRGATRLDPAVSRRAAAASGPAREPRDRPLLSPRELEVLRLVGGGMTNQQIGRALYIGEATVKTHLQHIFAKLEARDRAAAVSSALRQGLLG